MVKEFRRFSDEQIERANRVDVVEYARSMGFDIKRSGNWYKAKNQGGLYFYKPANTWHWETEGTGGVGAVSLCMKLENKTWVEAVRTLLDEEMESIRYAEEWKPEPEPPREFQLPNVNNTYRHMIAYLTKTRGIEASVVKAMIDRKYIYENTQKSCVFVGRDKGGNAHHASVRSTNTIGKVFKQDVPGSQKAFSFNVPGNSGILNVFEAPIDLLSYVSLQKLLGKQTKDSYVSLGGTTDKALERFLQDYPDIKKIRICTDNDKPLNELEWDANLPVKNILIRKNNMVKGNETDLHILFKTCTDYARYVKRIPEKMHYLSFPKNQVHYIEDEDIYSIEIEASKQYTLYESLEELKKGKGIEVSGKELNQHFYEMPAGEKAAVRIHEKYGDDYIVTRHRPSNKDFNEDLLVYRQQQEQVANNSQNMQAEQVDETDLFIQGKCEVLIICDTAKEIEAYRNLQRFNFKEFFDIADYEPDEYYLAYRSTDQVQEILCANPNIKKIWMRTSNNTAGKRIEEEVCQKFNDKVESIRNDYPKAERYSEDWAQIETIQNAIEETPIEEVDVAAGMEV